MMNTTHAETEKLQGLVQQLEEFKAGLPPIYRKKSFPDEKMYLAYLVVQRALFDLRSIAIGDK